MECQKPVTHADTFVDYRLVAFIFSTLSIFFPEAADYKCSLPLLYAIAVMKYINNAVSSIVMVSRKTGEITGQEERSKSDARKRGCS